MNHDLRHYDPELIAEVRTAIEDNISLVVHQHTIDSIVEKGNIEASRVGDTTATVAVFTTEDGVVITDSMSIPQSTKNFNEGAGMARAIDSLKDKVAGALYSYEVYAKTKRVQWLVEKVFSVAEAAHEVNRVYCQSIGDNSQTMWHSAPTWQKVSAVRGVLFKLANPGACPEDMHESWCAEKERTGWTYGEVKCPERRTHPCLVPYNELPKEQQVKDSLFSAVVTSLLPKREEY